MQNITLNKTFLRISCKFFDDRINDILNSSPLNSIFVAIIVLKIHKYIYIFQKNKIFALIRYFNLPDQQFSTIQHHRDCRKKGKLVIDLKLDQVLAVCLLWKFWIHEICVIANHNNNLKLFFKQNFVKLHNWCNTPSGAEGI